MVTSEVSLFFHQKQKFPPKTFPSSLFCQKRRNCELAKELFFEKSQTFRLLLFPCSINTWESSPDLSEFSKKTSKMSFFLQIFLVFSGVFLSFGSAQFVANNGSFVYRSNDNLTNSLLNNVSALHIVSPGVNRKASRPKIIK
jgi:hypothetical protein